MNPHERQPHLSRAERRAAQREAAKQQKKTPKRTAPYVIGTIGAVALIGAAVYAGKSFGGESPHSTPTPGISPNLTTPDIIPLPDSTVLAQEIRRLGIQSDAEEQSLWETRERTPIPTDKQEILDKTIEKIDQTLDKMSKSKIKQLRDDVAYIRSMIATGKMSFLPIYEESLKGTFEAGSHMTTMFRVTPDKTDTTIYLRVALEKTLQQNFLANATTLSHEAFHIRILEKEQTKMKQAGLSVTEQMQQAQTKTYEDSIQEELEAYEHATRIYITAMGLTNGKEASPTGHHLAAILIKARYDTKNPLWRNYVEELNPNPKK